MDFSSCRTSNLNPRVLVWSCIARPSGRRAKRVPNVDSIISKCILNNDLDNSRIAY